MIPAKWSDEDIRHALDRRLDIALLFPVTAARLVHVAAEYAHRFGSVHRSTPSIGRAASHVRVGASEAFARDDDTREDTLTRWRNVGATWTRRRPPSFVPRDEVLHVPVPGTTYSWDNGEVYRYVVLRACSDAIVLRDMRRPNACVVPPYHRFHEEYIPTGTVEKHYRFGLIPCGVYGPLPRPR